MKKQFFLLAFAIGALTACRNNENEIQLTILKKELANNIEHTKQETKIVLEEMEIKLQDPQTRFKAKIWQPRAANIKILTDSTEKYFNSLIEIAEKQNKSITERKQLEIYNQLTSFENQLVAITNPDAFSENTRLREDILRKLSELKLNTFAGISSEDGKKKELASYFENTSALGSTTMLYKIKADVLECSREIISYFNVSAISNNDSYTVFSAIATLSTTYLKKGEPLIVYAGIGAFSIAAKPEFMINGKNVLMNNVNGIATDTLIIDKMPGHYSVPVKIKFTRPDGFVHEKSTLLKYTVAN